MAAGFAALFEEPERVMKPETAFIIDWLMREVVRGGTGSGAGALKKPAVGKTGTTNDSFDTWFMGFTKGLVTDGNPAEAARRCHGGRAEMTSQNDESEIKKSC